MATKNSELIKEPELSKKQQRQLNKEYRKAADAIITEQVKTTIKSLIRRRNEWKRAFAISAVVNIILAILVIISQ